MIRFGTCKRSPAELVDSLIATDAHIQRFLTKHPTYRAYRTERVAIAPKLDRPQRAALKIRGYLAEDLGDLTAGL